MNHLHDRIRKTRLELGISQAELAQATGVSQPTVANWENGSHTPRKGTLERIGAALKVEPLWLLSGTAGQASHAAQDYLSLPIRHVPVYAWPDVGETHLEAGIVTYVPFATKSSDIFALTAPTTANAGQHIIVIEPGNTVMRADDICVWADTTGYLRTRYASAPPDASLIGRTIADIQLY